MIIHTSGDILQDDADALVNPVNCVGVMGKGLALQFKEAYPENFEEYEIEAKAGHIVPGRVHLTNIMFYPPRFIVNFPTKRYWKEPSRYQDIDDGLSHLLDIIRMFNIESIAIPALGCGLGGLDWEDVKELIESRLGDLDTEVRLYHPENSE